MCRLVKSSDVENTKITLQALENKMAVMLRFLGHEDDDVSGAVAQFAHDYISILKQMQPVSHSQRKHVEVRLINLNEFCIIMTCCVFNMIIISVR